MAVARPRAAIRIGTAGWSIPTRVTADFPTPGSHLERYARRFDAVEINSSFYRPHRRATYERWAESVPEGFRFAVKLPKAVTHEARLRDCGALVDRFAEEVAGLGGKLGVVLVQLPPSLAFSDAVAPFLGQLRVRLSAALVCEPRHASWFTPEVDAVLARLGVARAAADPSPVSGAETVGGCRRTAYVRLHGSPRMYWSRYDAAALQAWWAVIRQAAETGAETWVVFDNTAEGAAIENAAEMAGLLQDSRREVSPAAATDHVERG